MVHPEVDALVAQAELPKGALNLARRWAPFIHFDAREPFLPLAAGVTLFDAPGPSPSFPRDIPFPDATAAVIEYAVWWDWDIQHLYELEHIWVFLDGVGKLVRVDASWHGGFNIMQVEGTPPMADGRPVVWSEPGKHAFAASMDALDARRTNTARSCGRYAGVGGVLVTPLFDGKIVSKTPQGDRLAHTWLERQSFVPSFEFTQRFDLARVALVPWPALAQWIPQRVAGWVTELGQTIPPEDRRYLRVGHRGARAHAPENTLASFRKAVELGADFVELDVHRSADGVPVVIHDADLARTTDGTGFVSERTLAELKQLDAGGGERIPTLAEVVAAVRDEAGLYIELKAAGTPALVVETLRAQDYVGACIVGSFQPELVAEAKRLEPRLRTAILFSQIDVDAVALARGCGADYVHPCWERSAARPHELLTPMWIEQVRAAGLGIVAWHEERPEEIAALRRLGVDAICSDRPELLRMR
jgi:glycerophosphoryl diester phosphodiesterase